MLHNLKDCTGFWDCVIKSAPNPVALGNVVLSLFSTPSVLCRRSRGRHHAAATKAPTLQVDCAICWCTAPSFSKPCEDVPRVLWETMMHMRISANKNHSFTIRVYGGFSLSMYIYIRLSLLEYDQNISHKTSWLTFQGTDSARQANILFPHSI